MEVRTITVVTTSNQRRYEINTDATTLAELKAALRANNVPYEGMTFYEGLSHSELLTDDAILPHDLPYQDTTTNELVFMLTTPNKKIRSGADDVRNALYTTIKELGLQDAVVAKYGRNFTQCKNAELLAVIEEHQATAENVSEGNLAEAFDALLDILESTAVVGSVHIKKVRSILKGESAAPKYSDAEIDAMFDFVNR